VAKIEEEQSILERDIQALREMTVELETAKSDPQSSLEKYLQINPQEAFQETKLALADIKSLINEINKTHGSVVTHKDLKEKRKKYKRHARLKIMSN